MPSEAITAVQPLSHATSQSASQAATAINNAVTNTVGTEMTGEFSTILTRLHGMWNSFLMAIPNIIVGLIVFVLALYLAGFVRNAVRTLAQTAGQPTGIALVFGRIARWAVLALGFLIAATIAVPSLDAAALLGTLGFGGVAIGFAFKDIFQNLLAGLLILITRPFRIGDQIVSGNHEGTVEDIQVRATLIRTYDNRRVVIPNSELFTGRVVVNTAYDKRRIAVNIGVGFGEQVSRAKVLIEEHLPRIEGILPEPAPKVLVTKLGDYAVNLEVRFWVDPPIRKEVVETQDAVLQMLQKLLPEHGIEMPFPTSQVLVQHTTPEEEPSSEQEKTRT